MRRAKTAEQLTEALKTNKAANEVRDISRAFMSLWLGSLDGYFAAIEVARTLKRGEKREAIAKARGDLLTSMHSTLDSAYRQAYAKGRDFWGARPSNALSDRAATALATQKQFATKFAADVFSGHVFRPGNMPPAQRTAMYARGLEGAFQRAVVDATPPGFTIWWRLGAAKHCVLRGRVLTRFGEVPIQQVRVGDEVWTHRSRWRRVEAVHSVLAGSRSGSMNAVSLGEAIVTGDHEAWTLDGWAAAETIARDSRDTIRLPHAGTLAARLDPEDLATPYPEEVPPEEGTGGRAGGALSRSRRRQTPRELLRRLEVENRLPTHLEMDSRERADLSRPCLAPSRREQGERLAGELGATARLGSSSNAHDDGGRLVVGDPCEVLALWGHVHGDEAQGVGHEDGQSVLRETVSRSVDVDVPRPAEGEDRLLGVRAGLREVPGAGESEEDVLARLCGEPFARAEVVGRIDDRELVWDITVEEDRSYVLEGAVVANCVDCPIIAANSPYTQETLPTMPRAGSCQCRTNCKCFLEFKTAAGVYVRDKPLTAIQRERGRGVRQRVEGPKPKPPRGLRLATEKERIVLADLEARQAFAVRRIDRARARGDDAELDRWIGHRRDVSGQIREFADSRKIWHVPTFSTSEIVRGEDLRSHDVNWMTHIRGLDGFTVHRAQEAAIEQATKAARKNLDKLLDSLPPSGGTVVPDFDELVRLAGGDTGSFVAKFGDATITEAEDEPVALDPGQHAVFSLVGLGGAATLRVFEKAIALLRKTERAIWIGPMGGEDWLEVALEYGFVVEGPAKVVQDFIAELSRAVGGRGVEAAPWQA